MLKIDFTNEMVFGFEGPNICFLGKEDDFLQLAKLVAPLTGADGINMELTKKEFILITGDIVNVLLASKTNGNSLAILLDSNTVLFELDAKYWERLFKYFVLLSWTKCTYYLNAFESYLSDLNLKQDCNFICSSGFE